MVNYELGFKKTYNLLLLFVLCGFSSFSQDYTVTYFQSNYDTLTNYRSLSHELIARGKDPFTWQDTIALGFDFPFFDTSYKEVIMENDGAGSFPGSPVFNLYLFQAAYQVGNYPNSENRYKHDTLNGLKVYQLEYRNVFLESEYADSGANHFINFQTWFFENGTIEIHFGEIDLRNCSHYFPGKGFSFDPKDPKDNIYGPWAIIQNDNETKGACFSGDYKNPFVSTSPDSCDVLTSIPPKGFIIRFERNKNVSNRVVHAPESNLFKVVQHQGKIEILGDINCFSSCTVYDVQGGLLGNFEDSIFILTEPSNQILIFKIEGTCGVEYHRIFFQN